MKTLRIRQFMIATLVACFTWLSAIAQSEKVSIRRVPSPNQTVRLKMVQEMTMDVSFDADPNSPPNGMTPMKMTNRTVMGMLQKVGSVNGDGNTEVEITYDDVHSEAQMNGQPVPMGDIGSRFVGKTMTVAFNKDGNIVNFKIPSDIGLPEETLRKMLEGFYGSVPKDPIAVGEVTTTPLDFTIPLPLPGVAPMKLVGEVKSKLVAIDKDCSGRIAKFESTTDGKLVQDMELPSPAGAIKMNIDFKMNGTGTSSLDLDKGLLKSSDGDSIIGGKITMVGNLSPGRTMPAMNLSGKIKITVTSGN